MYVYLVGDTVLTTVAGTQSFFGVVIANNERAFFTDSTHYTELHSASVTERGSLASLTLYMYALHVCTRKFKCVHLPDCMQVFCHFVG